MRARARASESEKARERAKAREREKARSRERGGRYSVWGGDTDTPTTAFKELRIDFSETGKGRHSLAEALLSIAPEFSGGYRMVGGCQSMLAATDTEKQRHVERHLQVAGSAFHQYGGGRSRWPW